MEYFNSSVAVRESANEYIKRIQRKNGIFSSSKIKILKLLLLFVVMKTSIENTS